MKDHAEEVTTRTEDGLATIPFWQHEYELWKSKRREKIIIAVLIASNLIWLLATIKH